MSYPLLLYVCLIRTQPALRIIASRAEMLPRVAATINYFLVRLGAFLVFGDESGEYDTPLLTSNYEVSLYTCILYSQFLYSINIL